MKKILFVVGVVAIIGLGIFAISNIAQKPNNNSQKITVITTLFPMYDFAKNIGGDKINVLLLLPPGVESHTFEPKPSDIAKINEARIFIYTGEFMEPWAHDIIASVKDKVKVVDASAGIVLMKKEDELGHEYEYYVDEHSYYGGVDPHIWLDFGNADIMVKTIANALTEVDPANADYYQNNAKRYSEQLANLDNAYKNTLAVCESKTIVHGGHYAFGYMAKRYGLEYMAAQGFSPDAEPTAKDLIALVEQIKNENIRYVFYEELVSPKIAETLAKETGAGLLPLNPAHNLTREDFEKGASFLSIMEENLVNLKTGLQCSG